MRQRKTDDQEILRLLEEGKTQREIACRFGVSPVAIHKRLKRLTPPPDAPNFNQLTSKEKRFVLEKISGKSNINAVMQSHDVTTKGSAKSMASQLMAKPEIQMSISELMEYCGIDKPYRIRRLKQIIDSSDLNIAHKGLDMSFRLDASYAPERHMSMNVNCEISDDERKELEELAKRIAEEKINELRQSSEKQSEKN